MGIHSYDETYLDTVACNLGTMFEYANSVDIDQVQFWHHFTTSNVSKQIEQGNPKYLAGLSSIDLLNEVINSKDVFIEPDSFNTPTRYYWAGWALAQLQFHKAISFYEINKYLPIEKVLSLYDTLHEADITKFIDVSDSYFNKIEKETNLKQMRIAAGLSQSMLAKQAQVSIRSIQMYEQKQNDINKAQIDILHRIAKVLGCNIEDLLEFFN